MTKDSGGDRHADGDFKDGSRIATTATARAAVILAGALGHRK
jgi:hypothetical protein